MERHLEDYKTSPSKIKVGPVLWQSGDKMGIAADGSGAIGQCERWCSMSYVEFAHPSSVAVEDLPW
jgi:hypothetical protein